MSPTAVAVKPIEDYKLFVTFDNGEEKIYDVKPLIKGTWFGQLENEKMFNTVHIGGISVEWDGGQDICPDDLYNSSIAYSTVI